MNAYRYLLPILLIVLLLTGSVATPGISAQTPPPAPAPLPAPAQQPDAALEPGGFIYVEGSRLMRHGKPVTIKGVNYYPRGRPWGEMWDAWDAPQMQAELALAREQLGINAVRVLLPLRVPREIAVLRLRELAQIAGDLDMRLIVTLFDFDNSFPEPGSSAEREHVRYLEAVVGAFANDDRIFAWDLHNEPDHYEMWLDGKAHRVLTWLSRMASHVKRIAPNHLVTVGMGQYDNLWQPGPDGQRVIDYSDVVSIHMYNAADAARQLYELGLYTDKPILIEEFGWPSGPQCAVSIYAEHSQEWVYRTIIEAARANPQVAGLVAWTLRDFDAGPTQRWDTHQEHYGLYRPDNSMKPAAAPLRDYPASPLPSLHRLQVPLTIDGKHGPEGGHFASKLIPEANRYVKGWFRRSWDVLGGVGLYGLPLSEAFERPEDGVVVQYFEATVLEFHPTNTGSDFNEISTVARAKRMMKPMDIGLAYTEGREFPKPESVPSGARTFQDSDYTLQGEFLDFL
ncbi:MAG: cellulase family glycosylhydrolase [Chloroflexaceae bacterium]|nr:cellulase family glycosylhydrolase [Chloroflexaceae bacterium]